MSYSRRTFIAGGAHTPFIGKGHPDFIWKRHPDFGVKVNKDGVRRNVLDVLRYPDMKMARIVEIWPEMAGLSKIIGEQLEIIGLYSGYMDRQETDIRVFRKDESLVIPESIDFDLIGGLSNEVCLKLKESRPDTLGAAARIPGVTPAALTALLGFVRRKARNAA